MDMGTNRFQYRLMLLWMTKLEMQILIVGRY
jgi:hypothetical protein